MSSRHKEQAELLNVSFQSPLRRGEGILLVTFAVTIAYYQIR